MNVYEKCPVIEGTRYLLRLVGEEDAEDLYKVYSDKLALPFFNSDNCHGANFYTPTLEDMREAIRGWRRAYEIRDFVRFSVVDKGAGCVIGTAELFHRFADDAFNDTGVLRLDLGSGSETHEVISEILRTIVPHAFGFFDCSVIITKAPVYAVERTEALKAVGFIKSEAHLIGHIDGFHYRDYWTINVENMGR